MAEIEKQGLLEPGTILGEYEISQRIAEGGVSEIYLARQLRLDRDVAIKALKNQDGWGNDVVNLFEKEAKTIARLNHPNIVQVIDCGRHEQLYYFVMEYVDGTNFKEILEDNLFTLPQRLKVIVQTLRALEYAHNNGVIHRDIKPANLLISQDGHAKVADFGIALVKDSPSDPKSETVVGTPAYMSPEQWNTSGDTVDHRTDIYSTGVILYEALTSKKPAEQPVPPSAICTEVSPRFDSIVLKCLEKNPDDRYMTAVELRNDLLTAMQDISPQQESRGETKLEVSLDTKYTFLDTLSESPYGATYLVKNTSNGTLCIIKKLSKKLSGIREARILSKLSHPNLIKIYGAGADKEKGIMITEYAQGGSLADRLLKPYSIKDALRIITQIASGLSYAHKNKVIHGNLRPSNILFDRNNNVKLTDFALPEHYFRKRGNWYTAPERTKSRASDIYAAGVILHQLLTSRLPDIRARGELAWISKSSNLRFTILNIMSQMLDPIPSQRPESFDIILSQIGRFVDYSGSSPRASAIDKTIVELNAK
jgi:serine/threonine-protein kinase